MEHNGTASSLPPKRRPGRPPVYVFTKPDAELSENERRLKGAVLKRRMRQNKSYHRKKRLRQVQAHDEATVAAAATAAVSTNSFRTSSPLLASSAQRLNTLSMAPPHVQNTASTQQPQMSFPSHHFSIPPLSLPVLPPPNHTQLLRQPTHNVPQQQARPALSSFSLSPSVPRCGDLPGGGTANAVTNPANVMVAANTPATQTPGRVPDPLSPTSFASPTASTSSPRTTNVVSDDTRALQQLLDLSSSATTIPSSRHPNQHHISISQPLQTSSGMSDGGGVDNNHGEGDMTTRIASLPRAVADNLPSLAMFPMSFTTESALAVVAPNGADLASFTSGFIHPLLNSGIIRRLIPLGRFALDNTARALFTRPGNCWKVPDRRMHFIDYFSTRLGMTGGRVLCGNASDRGHAMREYDMEEANIRAAISFAREDGPRTSIRVLALAAPVMRVFIPPRERIELFSATLQDIEKRRRAAASPNSVGCRGTETDLGRRIQDEEVNAGSRDGNEDGVESEARVRLALAEAYFDALSVRNGQAHLTEAINSMSREARGVAAAEVGRRVSSIVALLLLVELRTWSGMLDDACALLGQAMHALREAGLQKSTYAVCCLLSLASIHATRPNQGQMHRHGQQEDADKFSNGEDVARALSSVQNAMDMVKELGLQRTPIYADVLRTLAMVRLRSGDVKQAQSLLFSAMDTLDGWYKGAGDWHSTPTQDGSTGLQVLLIEELAQTYTMQDRHGEASKLMERATHQRREFGLECRDGVSGGDSRINSLSGVGRDKSMTRHLY